MYVKLLLLDVFVFRAPNFQRFIYDLTVGSSTTSRSVHLRPHGRFIYDLTVGSSTTSRSVHLRPHGRFIYDLTVGSSTTSRSVHLRPHGRDVSVLFNFSFHNQITFCCNYVQLLYANSYVQLLSTSFVFSSIIGSYVIQGHASLDVGVTASITSQFRELGRSHQNIDWQH